MQGMSDIQLGGRYKVLEAFEHGLKCRDEQANTLVWLKPMPDEITSDPALLADAKRRCETLKNVQHEGIAKMLDVVSAENGKTYMVIEYVEGITLRRWMQEHREDGIVPAKYSVPVLKELASALDAAHAVNEIHRHLMPECIMINKQDKPKILNLGIPYAGSDNAWMLEPWKSTGWEAFYRAPEQWRGQICTTWTDLYALGCIAYEMLSGHVPFDIPDLNLLHGAVLLEAPPTIVSLPVAAQGTIARSLAKRGSERFNSCEDYIRSLSFETSQTKTVPKPITGNVPKVNQPYAVPDIPNGVWTATTAAAAVAAAGNSQNTGTIRGVTRGIPIALPNMPNTGTVRTVTGPLKTGPITGNYGKTGPITGKYTRTHTHILSNANEEIYGVWSDEAKGVKSVLFRVILPLILISVIASIMYYLIVKQAETLDETVIPHSDNDQYLQLTPYDVSTFGLDEEDKTEDTENDEEKKDSEDDSQKSSDDSEKKTDDSSKTDDQLQKEGDKNDDSNNEEKQEGDSPHTDKPSSDDDSSSMKNDDDSTDANTKTENQDENPQPLTPLEAAGAEAVTDNVPKRSSVRQGFGKAYIEATIHDKTIRAAKLTVDEKTYWSSVEIEAFAPDLHKVDVTAEYIDENHVSYRGKKSFTIDWVGRQKIQVEMVREDGVAKIVAIADGEPLEGADVYIDGRLYKTPNCEIEATLGIERKVEAKAFFKDDKKGLLFGSQSFVIDWKGVKTIYVEMKERKAVASAEQSVRLLPLNVDDLADGSAEKAMAASYSADGGKASTDQSSVSKDAGVDGIDKPMFMELIWVDSGSFEMGNDAIDAKKDEKPRHTVQISNGYWLGKYEVTQEEYRAMARYAGLEDDHSKYVGSRLPVDSITKKEAEKWCEALTRKERDAGRLPFGYEYRLPTEAEWEFAARGGRKSRGYLFSGSNKLIDVAWFDANRGTEDGTREVGGKEKNELGFYDMSGNVREWCHDYYEAYALKPVTDPMGRGNKVMARGGSWRNNTHGSRVTERAHYEPSKADDFIGFRVALAPVLPE